MALKSTAESHQTCDGDRADDVPGQGDRHGRDERVDRHREAPCWGVVVRSSFTAAMLAGLQPDVTASGDGVGSFHLVRAGSRTAAMSRLGLDRGMLRTVPGLRFWRLLGTGAGSRTGPGADLRRTALFAVWDDEGSLEAFHVRMAVRWASAHEAWHVRLRSAGGHGAWRGVPVLDQLQTAVSAGGPVAIITRADVHPRAWRAFGPAGVPR